MTICEVGSFMPILQMRNLGLRKLMQLASSIAGSQMWAAWKILSSTPPPALAFSLPWDATLALTSLHLWVLQSKFDSVSLFASLNFPLQLSTLCRASIWPRALDIQSICTPNRGSLHCYALAPGHSYLMLLLNVNVSCLMDFPIPNFIYWDIIDM